MIVKKVRRKQRRATNTGVRAHAAKLGEYIVDAREKDRRALKAYEADSHACDLAKYATAPEKVLASRGKNFRSEDFDDQLTQMDELIAAHGSAEDLVDHWVLSWADSDRPTVPQIFDAFDTFERCMGVNVCPSILGIHGNTKNPHGHLLVLRVDPATGQKINRTHDGWDKDAAHRALAVIAERYPEWKVTPNHLYEVNRGRIIHRETAADVGAAEDPGTWTPLISPLSHAEATIHARLLTKIDRNSLDFEGDTGFKSRKRVAIDEAVPILRSASDWLEAHTQLATLGIGLERAKNKSGANIIIDGKSVKASLCDSTSLPALEKKWGAYQPRPDHIVLREYKSRLMFPGDADRSRYYAAKRAFTATLVQVITDVRAAEHGYRSSVPSTTCDPSKLMRMSFPTYDDWLADGSVPDPMSVLTKSAPVCGIVADAPLCPEAQDVPGYTCRASTKGLAYSRIGDLYSRPALFDVGSRIFVNDDDDASIAAALRIMAERCPNRALRPFGPPDFIARVAKIAAVEGIAVVTRRSQDDALAGVMMLKKSVEKPSAMSSAAVPNDEPGKQLVTEEVPAVTAAEADTPSAATVKPAGASATEQVPEKARRSSGVRWSEAVQKPEPEESADKRQSTRRSPHPQQEAAKAAAAAWAAKWGRG